MSGKKTAAAIIIDKLKLLAGLSPGTKEYDICLVVIKMQALRAGLTYTTDHDALLRAAMSIVDGNDGGGAPPPP